MTPGLERALGLLARSRRVLRFRALALLAGSRRVLTRETLERGLGSFSRSARALMFRTLERTLQLLDWSRRVLRFGALALLAGSRSVLTPETLERARELLARSRALTRRTLDAARELLAKSGGALALGTLERGRGLLARSRGLLTFGTLARAQELLARARGVLTRGTLEQAQESLARAGGALARRTLELGRELVARSRRVLTRRTLERAQELLARARHVPPAAVAGPWIATAGAALRDKDSVRRHSPAATLAAVGMAMCAWTWAATPDLLIDFGREIYMAWRLSQGDALYVDIAHFFGPLPPYLNALWFRIFGPGIVTLAILNLIVLALLTVLLYLCLRAIGDRLSATAACVVFLTLFAFAHFLQVGNYNFVTPYSHGLTQGILLAFAGLGAVGLFAHRRQPIWLVLAGLTLGLVFLTKLEVFVAAAVAIGTGTALSIWNERPGPRRVRLLAVGFVGACLAAPIAAVLLLWTAMPLGMAIGGVFSELATAGNPAVTSLPFYRIGVGVDDVTRNFSKMFAWTGRYLLILIPISAVALSLRGSFWHRPVMAVRTFAGTIVLMAFLVAFGHVAWLELARPFPLLLSLILALLGYRLLAQRAEDRPRTILQIAMVVFALTLLSKIILNTRLHHYGFALAMPAALILVVALLSWLPATIERAGGYGRVFRAGAMALLSVLVVGYLGVTSDQLSRKPEVVGAGSDAIRSDARRGGVVAEFLDEMDGRLAPGQTMAVLPEGVMLNYLLRVPNPTPYTNLVPVQVALFGEDSIVAAFEAAPPDIIVIVHRDTSEFGYRYFGQDYGTQLSDWISENYRPTMRFGGPPLIEGTSFGIQVLELRKAT